MHRFLNWFLLWFHSFKVISKQDYELKIGFTNDHTKKVKALVLVKLLSLNINNALIVNVFNVFFGITLKFGFIMSPASPNSTRKAIIGKTSLTAEPAWNNVQLVIAGKEGVEPCRQGASRQLVQQVLPGVEGVLGAQGVPVKGPTQGS